MTGENTGASKIGCETIKILLNDLQKRMLDVDGWMLNGSLGIHNLLRLASFAA